MNAAKYFPNFSTLALICAFVLALAVPCRGQYNLFLRVDGVPGESEAAGHRGDIDATAFSHAVSAPGGGASSFDDLSVSKFVDKASPLLMLRCAQGSSIASVILFAQDTSPSPLDFYKVTLTNVRVTSLSTGGAVSGRPTETVSFTFERIEIIYTPRNPDGTPGTPVRACWDRATNRPC